MSQLTDQQMALYEIAYHLRMPLYKLLHEMPYDELQGWFEYFERRPVEWRADDRAAKIMQAFGTKEKPDKIFASLDAIYNKSKSFNEDGTNMSSLKGSALLQKMLQAKGGEALDL